MNNASSTPHYWSGGTATPAIPLVPQLPRSGPNNSWASQRPSSKTRNSAGRPPTGSGEVGPRPSTGFSATNPSALQQASSTQFSALAAFAAGIAPQGSFSDARTTPTDPNDNRQSHVTTLPTHKDSSEANTQPTPSTSIPAPRGPTCTFTATAPVSAGTNTEVAQAAAAFSALQHNNFTQFINETVGKAIQQERAASEERQRKADAEHARRYAAYEERERRYVADQAALKAKIVDGNCIITGQVRRLRFLEAETKAKTNFVNNSCRAVSDLTAIHTNAVARLNAQLELSKMAFVAQRVWNEFHTRALAEAASRDYAAHTSQLLEVMQERDSAEAILAAERSAKTSAVPPQKLLGAHNCTADACVATLGPDFHEGGTPDRKGTTSEKSDRAEDLDINIARTAPPNEDVVATREVDNTPLEVVPLDIDVDMSEVDYIKGMPALETTGYVLAVDSEDGVHVNLHHFNENIVHALFLEKDIANNDTAVDHVLAHIHMALGGPALEEIYTDTQSSPKCYDLPGLLSGLTNADSPHHPSDDGIDDNYSTKYQCISNISEQGKTTPPGDLSTHERETQPSLPFSRLQKAFARYLTKPTVESTPSETHREVVEAVQASDDVNFVAQDEPSKSSTRPPSRHKKRTWWAYAEDDEQPTPIQTAPPLFGTVDADEDGQLVRRSSRRRDLSGMFFPDLMSPKVPQSSQSPSSTPTTTASSNSMRPFSSTRVLVPSTASNPITVTETSPTDTAHRGHLNAFSEIESFATGVDSNLPSPALPGVMGAPPAKRFCV